MPFDVVDWLGDMVDRDMSLFYDEPLPRGVPLALGAFGVLVAPALAARVPLDRTAGVLAVALAIVVVVLGAKWWFVDDARDVLVATLGSVVLVALVAERVGGPRGIVVALIATPILMRAWSVLAWRRRLRARWSEERERARAILARAGGPGVVLNVQTREGDVSRGVLHDATGERPFVVDARAVDVRLSPRSWYVVPSVDVAVEPDASQESYRDARTIARIVRSDRPSYLLGDPRADGDPSRGMVGTAAVGLAALFALILGVARLAGSI